MNNNLIYKAFKRNKFNLINYIYVNKGTIFYITKDYAKEFNIYFDGKIVLEVYVNYDLFKNLVVSNYPVFKEKTNIIPKLPNNHICLNNSICYAPKNRPLIENWKFIDFVVAVDAMINNYFSKEYIGKGVLFELEHGMEGLRQYDRMIKNNKNI